MTEGIRHSIARSMLKTTSRRTYYKALGGYLRNNVMLGKALSIIHDIYADGATGIRGWIFDGERMALVSLVNDCRAVVANGAPLADGLRNWVSPVEASIIAAGERAGNLEVAFKDAIDLVQTGARIKSALKKALYPLGLWGMVCFFLYLMDSMLVPSMAQSVPVDRWHGALRMVYVVSQFWHNYGVLSLTILAATVGAAFYSLPRLTGDLRFRLERFQPWGTYRMIVAASMLQSLATLLRNGVPLLAALELLASNATPYLRERLDACIQGVEKGENLGAALESAEFDFPSRAAIKTIRMYADMDGFTDALADYANDWREEAVARIEAVVSRFMVFSMIGVAACVLLILAAQNGLTDAIRASTMAL